MRNDAVARATDLLRPLRFWKRPYGVDWIADARRTRDRTSTAWILDVGANIGDVAATLASRFPGCPLHAFEPVPSSYAVLRHRVRRFAHVATHQVAVSDQPGHVRMTAAPRSETNRIVADAPADLPTVTVEAITLDDFLESHWWPEVGLLKVDTEGFDLHVLKGAREAFARGLIDTFVAECTFNPRGAPHVEACELIALARDLAFDVVAVYSHNVGRFCRGSGYANVLFARKRPGHRA